MKTKNVAILGLSIFMLTACATSTEKRAEYILQAATAQPLEVPPEFTAPVADGRYSVSGKDRENSATYSEYNKAGATREANSAKVLPQSLSAHLERNGTQRWLVVEAKAENVWDVVKAFWLERGFLLEKEDAGAGVMVTDFLENKANLPQSGVKSTLARVFDSLRPYGERDQFRTRIERSQDGVNTEIYISHHGVQESPNSKPEKTVWLPRNSDPELENILLQQLMAKFSGTQVTIIKPETAAPSAVPSATAAVQFSEVSGKKTILIAADFEKSWRKVGLALDKARIAVEDKNREGRVFYLSPSTDKKITARYQVTLIEKSGSTEVTLTNDKGSSDQESLRLLELLFQRIEK